MTVLVDWTDNLSVQIEEIDRQHKKLIGLINELHNAMRIGQGKTVLEKILNELVVYTQTHFGYEEQLMLAYGFSDYTDHKREHEELTAKVAAIQAQYQSGAFVMSIEVLQFLKQWLSIHIQGSDMRYARFFNSKGIH